MKSASSGSQHRRTVFVGSESLLAAWNARGGQQCQVITVPLTNLTFAIDLIGEAQPEVVVIEQAVAASGDGSTLMDRLHSERYLRGIEVRLLPPDRAADLIASGPGDAHPQDWLSDARIRASAATRAAGPAHSRSRR